MGTIHIVNKTTQVSDRTAAQLVTDYWNGICDADDLSEEYKVRIIKKGHTFIVVDIKEEIENGSENSTSEREGQRAD